MLTRTGSVGSTGRCHAGSVTDGLETTALLDALRLHLARAGTIGFDEYVGHALYTPHFGFYTSGRGAGRRRDFLTSPEVGPLFGAVLARALDTWWDGLGRPDPYVVVEAGAGPGTLARSVLAADPRCADALHLVLVDPGETQWATHPEGVDSRAALPAPRELGDEPVVVLANELLDNLPFALVAKTGGGSWSEVRVGWDDAASALGEVLIPLDGGRARWCEDRAGADAAVGARLPVQADAAAWLVDTLALTDGGGRVVAIDYASDSASLARRPWDEWVRTYAAHGRAGAPLEAPGSCDITCEVAVDQLALVRRPDADRDQATFLRAHGLDELVEEGAARWRAEGHTRSLDAIAARSRVHEADALTDPVGLGAFRVLEWET